jgi:hypothetical protein
LIDPPAELRSPGELRALRKKAVDHLLAGRLPEAAAAYRSLTSGEPDEPADAVIVRVLERRIRDGSAPSAAIVAGEERP